jgi:excisionase family DNA binding protein
MPRAERERGRDYADSRYRTRVGVMWSLFARAAEGLSSCLASPFLERCGRAAEVPKPGGNAVEPELMTVNELCDYLRVHRTTIYRLLRKNSIPAFRVGSDWRFFRSRIDEWCSELGKKPLDRADGRGRKAVAA